MTDKVRQTDRVSEDRGNMFGNDYNNDMQFSGEVVGLALHLYL